MPKISDRALEVGLYLPLGAYARAREGLSDLTPDKLRGVFDGLVGRGQERTQDLTRVVRRRATKAEQATAKAAATVQKQVKLPRVAAPKTAGELPIASYNSLSAGEILNELRGLTQTELAKVYKFEKANEGRATILDAIDTKLQVLPIATYDALTVDEIAARLASLSESELKTLHRYEADTKNRTTVLEKIDSLL